MLIIDFVLFVARNRTRNCLKTITKNKSILIKARFAKKVIFKKITIVKKKFIFNKFIMSILVKSCKAIMFKFNIKNLANTKNSILANKILQIYILLKFLLLIFIINLVLFKTINLITIAHFIRLLRKLLILCYVKSN